MSKSRFVLPIAVLAVVISLSIAAVVLAKAKQSQSQNQLNPLLSSVNRPDMGGDEHKGHGAATETPTEAQTEPVVVQAAPNRSDVTFFRGQLTGDEEVQAEGGPAVGDENGSANAWVRIAGKDVQFALSWKGIQAPTAAHIHQGEAGANGDVKVPLFASKLPNGVQAVTGTLTADVAVLDQIVNDPDGFYFNVHTAEFPGGAVRAQLQPLDQPFDLNSVLREGPLTSLNDGKQEIAPQDGKPAGDPDGNATALARAWGECVAYSFTWSGIQPPTLGHIHKGGAGTNGDPVVPLFDATPNGLPRTITGMAGQIEGIDREVVQRINANPSNYYTNLHTGEFPGGAVRGQLFRAG
jgi:CHRD domain